MSLKGKHILLGISGSIAAYKAAFLTRLLVKEGAEVRVLMTPAAAKFITPLTLSTLSKHPVISEVSDGEGWNNHVELGLWADAMLVAPATATTLGKMAHAICDNIIVACYLSARCPVFFAPAMDLDMWAHPATQDNVSRLKSFGNHLIDVSDGELASGLSGKGRLAEPEEIVATLSTFFEHQKLLAAYPNLAKLIGKKALVTSGPTYEPIDPVRFIGNRSTGKMGTAIAEALAKAGVSVTLVTGPTSIRATHPLVTTIKVESSSQMFSACETAFETADIAVFAAAVADYTPLEVAKEKIKKNDATMSLELTKTIDIAKALGAQKRAGQIIVGFALETNDEMTHAKSKLEKKNSDFVVLNSLNDKGAGFGHDTNKITVIDRTLNVKVFDLKSKNEVAQDLVNLISEKM